MKRLCSTLLTILLSLSLLPVAAFAQINSLVSGFAAGTGSENDPYVIENYEELCYFRDAVASGYSFKDEYIVMTESITVNENWSAIGGTRVNFSFGSYVNLAGVDANDIYNNPDKYINGYEGKDEVIFEGSFNALGNEIICSSEKASLPNKYTKENYYPFEETEQSKLYSKACALFSSPSNTIFGSLKNVTIKNLTLSIPSDFTFSPSVTENSLIENCSFNAPAKSDYLIYSLSDSTVKNVRLNSGRISYIAASSDFINCSSQNNNISLTSKNCSFNNCYTTGYISENSVNCDFYQSTSASFIKNAYGENNFEQCTSTSGSFVYKVKSTSDEYPCDTCELNITDCISYQPSSYWYNEGKSGQAFYSGSIIKSSPTEDENTLSDYNKTKITVKDTVIILGSKTTMSFNNDLIVPVQSRVFKNFEGDAMTTENCYYRYPAEITNFDDNSTCTALSSDDCGNYNSFKNFNFLTTWRIQNGMIQLRYAADEPSLYGDANIDGKINAVDALTMRIAMSNGISYISDDADLDANGKLTAADALHLRKILASGGTYVPYKITKKALLKLSYTKGFESGSGTAEDPFIIKNWTQLCSFRDAVNNGFTFKGLYIALDSDIYTDYYSNQSKYELRSFYELDKINFEYSESALYGIPVLVEKEGADLLGGKLCQNNWSTSIGTNIEHKYCLGEKQDEYPFISYCGECNSVFEKRYFEGNFDGRGHTIYGLVNLIPLKRYHKVIDNRYNWHYEAISNNAYDTKKEQLYSGLFTNTQGAVIANINIASSYFLGFSDGHAGIVANPDSTTQIINCNEIK